MARAPEHAKPPGQHRQGTPLAIGASDFGPYRLLALTLLVAMLALGAGAALVLRIHSRSDRFENAAARTRTPPLVQAAEAWLNTNLPHSARVIADRAVRAALIQSGFPASSVTLPSGVVGCDAISFVVVTRALESAATKATALGGCLHSALPVAVFGTGPDSVRIAETVPAGSDALASQRSVDTYNRKLAGTALVTNPAVAAWGTARITLRTGQLDLRAATVIAVLAGRTDVRVTAVLGDPAEIAAGLPGRAVDVVLTDSAELDAVLATLSEPFRPSAIVRAGTHSYRLTWPFATAPVPGLS